MNKQDIAFWKFAFDVVQTIVTLGIAIYVWILSKHKVNSNKIAQLEEAHNAELTAVKTRLTAIETKVQHMPDREQIGNIHKRIDRLSEGVSAMQGEMKGVTDNTAMIIRLLAERGMKE